MFTDDAILAAKQRRADPLPVLLIVVTTLVASIVTAASALTAIA